MREYLEHGIQPATTVANYITQLNKVLATQQGRIKGEVTSLKQSGKAIYFTIKDKNEQALLDCMIWITTYQSNGLQLKTGDEIIVTGCPDIYAPFGKFCFKATTLEYAGEGALKRAYEQLKATLQAEGLFNRERKRSMPALPTKIGVITSMSGVVIQDFTANLSRHGFKVKTVDSRVEGKDAIHELLAALRTMSKQDIEVLVIMRGGGSWESLQAFNTESVVRAIAASKVPVLTGIGHDVDVTLSEMVADIGRSTPTAVAEALNEPWDGLASQVAILQGKTLDRYQATLTEAAQTIGSRTHTVFRLYERQLARVRTDVSDKSAVTTAIFGRLAQRVRDTNSVLLTAAGIMKTNLRAKRRYLDQLPTKLRQYRQTAVAVTEQSIASTFERIVDHQMEAINTVEQSADDNYRRAIRMQGRAIQAAARALPQLERAIAARDPKRPMRLGYSLSYANGRLLRSKTDVVAGETITTQLADGEFTSLVKEVQ